MAGAKPLYHTIELQKEFLVHPSGIDHVVVVPESQLEFQLLERVDDVPDDLIEFSKVVGIPDGLLLDLLLELSEPILQPDSYSRGRNVLLTLEGLQVGEPSGGVRRAEDHEGPVENFLKEENAPMERANPCTSHARFENARRELLRHAEGIFADDPHLGHRVRNLGCPDLFEGGIPRQLLIGLGSRCQSELEGSLAVVRVEHLVLRSNLDGPLRPPAQTVETSFRG